MSAMSDLSLGVHVVLFWPDGWPDESRPLGVFADPDEAREVAQMHYDLARVTHDNWYTVYAIPVCYRESADLLLGEDKWEPREVWGGPKAQGFERN